MKLKKEEDDFELETSIFKFQPSTMVEEEVEPPIICNSCGEADVGCAKCENGFDYDDKVYCGNDEHLCESCYKELHTKEIGMSNPDEK